MAIHCFGNGIPDVAKIRANMDRYAEIGVDVQITECDVRVGLPMTAEKEVLQTKLFGDLLQTCIDAPNCAHMTVWGLSDVDSWVPSTFKGRAGSIGRLFLLAVGTCRAFGA